MRELTVADCLHDLSADELVDMIDRSVAALCSTHRTQNSVWLVERIYDPQGMYPGDFEITHREVVAATSAQDALEAANKQCTADDDPNKTPFSSFGMEELYEASADYLWRAADGSSVAIEIRRIA